MSSPSDAVDDGLGPPHGDEEAMADVEPTNTVPAITQLAQPDSIMDMNVIQLIYQAMEESGDQDSNNEIEKVIRVLAENYEGHALMVDLVRKWLTIAGHEPSYGTDIATKEIQNIVLDSFRPEMIDAKIQSIPDYDPSWVGDLVDVPKWRPVLFELYQKHPQSVLLQFANATMQNKGYQELDARSVDIASFNEFVESLSSGINRILKAPYEDFPKLDAARPLPEDSALDSVFAKACAEDFAFFFTQKVLMMLAKHGENSHLWTAMSEALTRYAIEKRPDDVRTIYQMIFTLQSLAPGPVLDALLEIIERERIRPSEAELLFAECSSTSPPPVAIFQHEPVIRTLISSLFTEEEDTLSSSTTTSSLPPPLGLKRRKDQSKKKKESAARTRKRGNSGGARDDHMEHPLTESEKQHFVSHQLYILAFAVSVDDQREFGSPEDEIQDIVPSSDPPSSPSAPPEGGSDRPSRSSKGSVDRSELEDTMRFIGAVRRECASPTFGLEVREKHPIFRKHLEHPIVAACLLHWMHAHFTNPSYYQSMNHQTCNTIFFGLIAEIVNKHDSLSYDAFILVRDAFQFEIPDIYGDVLGLRFRRRLLNLFVHLVHHDEVDLVFRHMVASSQELDHSLRRHFVQLVLESTDHPYSTSFLNRFFEFLLNKTTLAAVTNDRESKVVLRKFCKDILQTKPDHPDLHRGYWKRIEELQESQ